MIVNFDKNSSEYLKKIEIEMDENSDFAVFIPKGFLNGHYCLSEECLFFYKWSESYVSPDEQFSILWNDDILNIEWPLIEENPILSSRDKKSKKIKEFFNGT